MREQCRCAPWTLASNPEFADCANDRVPAETDGLSKRRVPPAVRWMGKRSLALTKGPKAARERLLSNRFCLKTEYI